MAVKRGWYDASEVPGVLWRPRIGVDGALWRHIWPWRLVAVGWPEGGQMALIPQYHFIVADLSSEKHPILIRSVTKLCVMLYSTRIDDGGA